MKSLRMFLGKNLTRLACHSIAQQQPPAAANYQLKFTQYTIVLLFSNPRIMSKAPTKASYLQALASFGEVPPKSWGMTELKNRLLELEEEHGVVRAKGRVTTDLQAWTVKLNKAATKKAHLQAFCQEELGLTLTMNETIDQLKRFAMEKIYYLSKASPQDGVGFGAHASLTYEEIAMSQKDYCAWVVKTAKEGGCNYRLSRLARWLEHVEKEGITMANEIPSKGYTKPVLPKPKAAAGSLMGATPGAHSPKGSAQSATSSEAMKMMEETQKMMQQMMGAMAHIKEEVDQLKEEKPHKKKHNTSDGSFSQVDAEL